MPSYRVATLCAAFSLAALAAAPARAEMEQAFGNTLISRYADGGWVKHWFDRDGGYRSEWSSGRRISARWRVEGQRVCLSGITPRIMMISSWCSPMVTARVGQTWQSRDPLGRRVTNELQRGR